MINILCFPFAGGNKYSYNTLKAAVGSRLNFIGFELPGRCDRYREKLLVDIDQMVDDLMIQVSDHLQRPYAIFGHSMGSLLGCLIAKKICAAGLPKPLILFLSGGRSPVNVGGRTRYHLLPKEEFFPTIAALGGVPGEVMDYPDILELYEPIIRADFHAVETYVHREFLPVDIDLNIMIGDKDKVSIEEALTWKSETTGKIIINQFQGGHFFIYQHERTIVRIMQERLSVYDRAINF